ncbi:fimbrillin family protein [Bacteroides eggerthii]|nr:fimbrillin family protein [Bacteroides eggerthii]UWN87172.1 fimbrillin family protein [Bacteroides eggerthii]
MIKYLPAVLLFCSCTESGLLLRERERFAVHFSASGIGMEVTTRASSPLSDNTTLRILAFRRVGQSPDLQADEYMGEGTYRASLGNGSLTPVHSLLLRAGSYDFYALTPETATASGGGGSGIPGGGGSTTAPPYTVSVGHGMDYATSLTAGRTVDESNPSVPLNDLVRRCTRLVFELSPKAGNIKKVRVASAGLTNMTAAPVAAPLNAELPLAGVAQSDGLTIAGGSFSPPDKDLNTSAAAVVLPRMAGKFDFELDVSFNDMADAKFTAAMPPTLVFAPGTQYTFTLKMKGSSMQLTLTVVPWGESVMGGQGDIGASAPITVIVGAWENVTVPGETGGGNPTVSTGQWILNPDLDVLFGNYGLSTINGLPWASSQTLLGETGGGSTNVNSGSWAGTKDVPATTGDGKLPGSDDPDSV